MDPAALDPRARVLAVEAASLIRFDIAGANLAQDWATGEWYVLSISSTPPISCGPFAADKLHAYASYLKHRLIAQSQIWHGRRLGSR